MTDRVLDAAAGLADLVSDPIGSGISAAAGVTGGLRSAVGDAASQAVSDFAGLAANVVIATAGAALVVLGVRRTFGG